MRFLRRCAAVLALPIPLGICAAAASASVRPPIQIAEIPAPAAPGARDPGLATAADGSVWMAWWEPAAGGSLALRCARFDAAAGRWQAARTVTSGPEADFDPTHPPALTAGGTGNLGIAWQAAGGPTRGPQVWVSLSPDGGAAWTPPAPLSKESERVSLPSLASLADGRVLAVWVDGRAAAAAGGARRLYLRFVTGPQASAPDWLLARDAAPGCAPELTALLDGGALLAYRGRTPEGIEEPKIERLHGRNWQGLHSIDADGGKPADGLGEGPRIAADGGRVAAVWLTVAAGAPQVRASTSPDAGARFLLPARIDAGSAPGRPSVALLHDGAVLAVWLEFSSAGRGEVQFRRLAPEFNLDPPTPLGPAARAANGFPQVAVVQDYAGDVMSAQALIAFAGGSAAPGLHTLLATVPEGDLLATAADDCHCAPTPMQLRGYPIRGKVVAAGPAAATTWDIDAVPGVMDAGTHEFLSAAGVQREFHPGDVFLAHIERRGSEWWLFDARRLAEPP